MNQLFTIMRRWLLHDKKRTALTLASITLSVFLISFVGFYINTGLNALRAEAMYESPEHVTFSPESLGQVRILDNNVAWECRRVSLYSGDFGIKLLTDDIRSDGVGKLPDVTINGRSVFTESNFSPSAVMSGGEERFYEDGSVPEAPIPSAAHEVIVSTQTAARYGLEKGGSMTIRCTKGGARLFCGELNEDGEAVRDDDGNIIYREDADGSKMAELCSSLDKLADEDRYYNIKTVLSMLYSEEHRRKKMQLGFMDDDADEPYELPPMYAELTDGQETVFEYTATVTEITDVTDDHDMIFYIYDEDILPLLGGEDNSYITYAVRVKEDIDAESAALNAAKAAGLYTGRENGYELNTDLLVLEGRQLEYIENVAVFFAIGVVIMGMFMFLARLIINNAFEISAAYRTEQYGALKTIGASDRQIFAMIMLECVMYMLIALPAGTGLAVLVGKKLLDMIRGIKVFDPIMGDGVSDTFFVFRLSPAVMGVTFACALFSVFFSAYADALRVKRMPPIRSAGYSSSRRRIRGRIPWLSRKAFGYPFGFAVKCISKQKVRFAVTLLSAVLSGIFITAVGCITKHYADLEKETNRFTALRYDIEVVGYADRNDEAEYQIGEIKRYYRTLLESGYFETIIPNAMTLILNDGDPSVDAVLTEDYKALCERNRTAEKVNLVVDLIPRENYDKYIKTDISYDELAQSGKMLLCGTMFIEYDEGDEKYKTDAEIIKRYKTREGTIREVLGTKVFARDDIERLSFTGSYPKKDGNTSMTYTETVDIAGIYETDSLPYMSEPNYITAVLPLDSVNADFQTVYKNGAASEWYLNYLPAFSLSAKEDMKSRANDFARSVFTQADGFYIDSYISEDAFAKNGVKALRIAGFGLAGTIATVVLLNIFSTMSANMINRRRDLSMMRSCGMSMKQVTLSLVIESSFYGVITALVSSFAGSLIAGSVIWMSETGSDPYFEELLSAAGFPAWGFPALFGVIMLVTAAAYVPVLVSMNRSSVAEDIRTDL